MQRQHLKAKAEQIEVAAKGITEAAVSAMIALEEEDSCRPAALWCDLWGETQNLHESERAFPLPGYHEPDESGQAFRSRTG
ncbi:hypothetical protein [Crossiella cryophila]|uniref:Uncharacterized protein n=1 Tax=Crossiella cryophila TaxID=43355 RepID=A0A7W7CCM8_9PSEU|nr:hypothetical protein [Crossiella cryophila]MBB4677433.1 hypothetical protein [Crossiella cryophila]